MVFCCACEERLQQSRTWLSLKPGKLLHCVLDMLDLVLSLSLFALNVAEFGLRLASLVLNMRVCEHDASGLWKYLMALGGYIFTLVTAIGLTGRSRPPCRLAAKW